METFLFHANPPRLNRVGFALDLGLEVSVDCASQLDEGSIWRNVQEFTCTDVAIQEHRLGKQSHLDGKASKSTLTKTVR